ncbi:MAG: RelA/SpoT family protein [Flammeovirgaceae bacterium]
MMHIDEEKENAELLKLYRKLLRKAKPRLKDGDTKLIKKAFVFAADAHKDMRRKSGEPYIFHPMTVALIVAEEIGLGTTSIIAAFLHDVVEDTEYTLEDIEERFGATVANIIDGLTKMSATTQFTTSIQAENFRKMLLTISQDIRVVLIKIADRLHNMRTLNSMPRDKRLKIRSETAYIYAPLAHRLGLYSIKSELEDLGLCYSDPEAYDEIRVKVEQGKPERDRFFKMFVKPIKASLKAEGYDFEIKMRAKSNYSIYRKMQKQDIPFEQVYDYFAIRIILKGNISLDKEKSACWEVYSMVTDHYTPNTNRLRDWISVPRDNGYESLHITVMGPNGQWVEVQIRTERMDEVAEKGYAAHWRYKETTSAKGKKKAKKKRVGLEHWLAKVRELLENNDLNAFEFLDDFRANLYQDEVYAFTPKGDLKKFPTGASVLDFAFEIHTEVGAKCLGAKVNGKLVPLNYKLQNGDQVEILTSNQPKANEGWLKYVVTSRARSKIKDYLKEDFKRLAALGKEVVMRKFKQMKIQFNERNVTKLTHFFNYKTESEFYYHIGNGDIDHTEIKRFKDQITSESQSSKLRPETAKEFKREVKKLRKSTSEDELVIGENMDSLEYSLAKCCSPIPGDNIFGFITVNSGIKIHRTSCPNAVSLLANYGHRVIKTRWASHQEEEFEADLIIEGTDRIGLVNDITKVISNQMKVNIKSINIGTNTGIFRGNIALSVHDSEELGRLIINIENIEGIIKVIRMEEKV